MLKSFMILFLCSFLLLTGVCTGSSAEREADPASASAVDSKLSAGGSPESNTTDFKDAWTLPQDTSASNPPAVTSGEKEDRERMIETDTEEYIRTWTFSPDTAESNPASTSGEKAGQERMIETDTDEYINGWSFE